MLVSWKKRAWKAVVHLWKSKNKSGDLGPSPFMLLRLSISVFLFLVVCYRLDVLQALG